MPRVRTALIGLAWFALALAACGGDGEPAVEGPTPTAAPTETGAGKPQVIDGVEVVPLEIGDEIPLPEDVALVLEIGCVECHCPCVSGLARVYRDESGVKAEVLFRPEDSGLPPRRVVDPKAPGGTRDEAAYIIGGFAAGPDGAQIAVAVCSRGYCGPYDASEVSADAQTSVFRSLDGGATWEQLAVVDGTYSVEAVLEDGVVVGNALVEKTPTYQVIPSGDLLERPPEAGPGFPPFVLPSGELVWRTEDNGRLLRGDGSQFIALAVSADADINDIVPEPDGERFATVSWLPETGGGFHFGLAGRDGRLRDVFTTEYCCVNLGGWLGPGRAIGHAYVIPSGAEFSPRLWRPVILDVDAGVIRPLAVPNVFDEFQGSGAGSIARSILALERRP